MSYYDPRIYNYSNLKEEDKEFVDHALIIINSIDDMKGEYLADEESTVIERILCETGAEVVKEVEKHVIYFILDYLVAMIDSYEETVEMKDTDSFLYGIDPEKYNPDFM